MDAEMLGGEELGVKVGKPHRRMAVSIGPKTFDSKERSPKAFRSPSTFGRVQNLWNKLTFSTGLKNIVNTEDILDELDMQMVHAKPHSLESLSRRTLFERNEIKDIYRRFKQECPNGYLTEETFRSVFQQFFPVGDTNQYAHFVFNTFERDQFGNVLFEDFLQVMSVILKGDAEQKLEWVFKLYDIDRDEVLSRQDLKLVVESMYYMVGKNCEIEELAVKRHVDGVMKKYSRDPMSNEITLRQFKEACSCDDDVVNSMNSFGNIFFNDF